ncbi:MAG: redoxin domain-containing protein [Armatimonadetes bacterium]|nr:redoxin domain-containing protein [Armatimonadota bacterium]
MENATLLPRFEAATTHESLEDYRGKRLALFSHPADFTPVCTTEFLAFSRCPGCERSQQQCRGLVFHY